MTSITALGRSSLISNIFASSHQSSANAYYDKSKTRRRTSLQCDMSSSKMSPSRSFYRQPNIQRVRPAPSLELRRQQYGRFLWVSDGFLSGHTARLIRRHSSAEVIRSRDVYSEDREEDDGVRPVSILKRGVSEEYPETPIKSSENQYRKQLSFHENVDVVYFDCLEKPTTNERKEKEKLKDTTLSQLRVTARVIHMPCTLHTDDNRSCEKNEKCECPVNPNHIFPGKKGEVVKDITGRYSWKLFIPIGDDFIRNRTSVKALSGGHKLIVLTYKDRKSEDGKLYYHQYIEKLHMPHPIDAYGVRASMDKDGNLKITAPFLSDKFKL